MKDTFVISCPIDCYAGYGARSRDLVKALIELDKYDVKILQQRWGNTPWGFIEDHEEWHFLKPHLIPVGQKLTQKPEIWSQISVPNEFQAVGKYNIGITAGIETTNCAPQWIDGLNKMDLNLVSSNHSKKSFLNSVYEEKNKAGQVIRKIQLQKPMEVLFEGANLDKYYKTDSSLHTDISTQIDGIPESFAFLFVGHWLPGNLGEDRKNVGLMIKAFYETFKNKKNKPALILKTSTIGNSYMGRDAVIKKIKTIEKTVNSKNLPNVYLLQGDLQDSQMNELYNHKKVKAMVSFTKGEGFGRPLLEFSLSQKPIISTNWSGHIDFLKPEFTKLIGGDLKPIHQSAQVKDMLIEGSHWFAPNSSEIGHSLKDMFENYKNYIDGGKRQGYYSKTNFSFEGMKNLLGTILDKNVPEFPKQVELKLPELNLPKLEKL